MTIKEFEGHCAACKMENKYELVYCTLANCEHFREYKESKMHAKEMYNVKHAGFEGQMNLNGIVNLFQGQVERDLLNGLKEGNISDEYRDFLVDLSRKLDQWKKYN